MAEPAPSRSSAAPLRAGTGRPPWLGIVATSLLAAAALAAPGIGTAGDTTKAFDGAWEVILTCPPHHEDDDAKGYTHRFAATIEDGVLVGTHGSEGQPSWHRLVGPIAADGTALLTLDGIVNNPAYAINNAQRGKPYSYRVRARFEGATGAGQRIGKRRCNFDFKRL